MNYNNKAKEDMVFLCSVLDSLRKYGDVYDSIVTQMCCYDQYQFAIEDYDYDLGKIVNDRDKFDSDWFGGFLCSLLAEFQIIDYDQRQDELRLYLEEQHRIQYDTIRTSLSKVGMSDIQIGFIMDDIVVDLEDFIESRIGMLDLDDIGFVTCYVEAEDLDRRYHDLAVVLAE